MAENTQGFAHAWTFVFWVTWYKFSSMFNTHKFQLISKFREKKVKRQQVLLLHSGFVRQESYNVMMQSQSALTALTVAWLLGHIMATVLAQRKQVEKQPNEHIHTDTLTANLPGGYKNFKVISLSFTVCSVTAL